MKFARWIASRSSMRKKEYAKSAPGRRRDKYARKLLSDEGKHNGALLDNHGSGQGPEYGRAVLADAFNRGRQENRKNGHVQYTGSLTA